MKKAHYRKLKKHKSGLMSTTHVKFLSLLWLGILQQKLFSLFTFYFERP